MAADTFSHVASGGKNPVRTVCIGIKVGIKLNKNGFGPLSRPLLRGIFSLVKTATTQVQLIMLAMALFYLCESLNQHAQCLGQALVNRMRPLMTLLVTPLFDNTKCPLMKKCYYAVEMGLCERSCVEDVGVSVCFMFS